MPKCFCTLSFSSLRYWFLSSSVPRIYDKFECNSSKWMSESVLGEKDKLSSKDWTTWQCQYYFSEMSSYLPDAAETDSSLCILSIFSTKFSVANVKDLFVFFTFRRFRSLDVVIVVSSSKSCCDGCSFFRHFIGLILERRNNYPVVYMCIQIRKKINNQENPY